MFNFVNFFNVLINIWWWW